MLKTGSVSTILSSDVTKAYAWLRDQRDERDERLDEQGADRTAHCLRSADGVFRAPLAVLIDRGESTEDDHQEEGEDVLEAFVDDIDDDSFADEDDRDRAWDMLPEHDDEYSQMAEQLLGNLEDTSDPEPVPVSSTILVSNHESNNPVLRHLVVGKTVIRYFNRYLERDRTSWKANTSAPKQCLRHA